MQVQGWFARLKRTEVQALFEPSAQVLRENYISILTLLQDLLGRYSSLGNATVFHEGQEVIHLLYDALATIRASISEEENFSRFALKRITASSLPSNKEWDLLIIEGTTYHFKNATSRFIKKLEDELSSLDYSNKQKRRNCTKDQLESSARTLNEAASANIGSAQMLQYLCESSKDLTKKPTKAVDNFLDALLSEYNLLRSPSSSDLGSPKSSREKVLPRGHKHASVRD